MIQEEYSNYIIFSLVFIENMYLHVLHRLAWKPLCRQSPYEIKTLAEEERLLAS